jgi:hypothetical protein
MEALLDGILAQDICREALRQIEASPKLALLLQGRPSVIEPERARRIRIWVARAMLRAGFFSHARKLLRDTRLVHSPDYKFAGVFEMAFGDLGAALGHFSQAMRLAPSNIGARGSYLHALAHAGDPKAAWLGLEKLLEEHPKSDERGWLTARIGDCLHLLGRDAEAHDRLLGKLNELERAPPPRFLESTDHGHLLDLLGACTARLEGPAEADRWLSLATRVLFRQTNPSYPNLIWGLRRILEAGIVDDAVANLLRALATRFPGVDLRGNLKDPVRAMILPKSGSSGATIDALRVDLSRDEYSLRGQSQLNFGVPLEVQVIAWAGLIRSALVSRVEPEYLHVPRGLLIDLLWPGAPAELDLLDNRLSKLLTRASGVHGVELRDPSLKRVVGPRDPSLALEFRVAPMKQAPSYLEGEVEPTVAGFAAFYRMSSTNARRVKNELLASGLWPSSPRRRARRAA